PRWDGDGNGGAGDPCARIDRPHIGPHQPGAPLCFVHRGHAAFAKPFNQRAFRPVDILNNDTHHSSSTVLGKTDWNASAYFAGRPPACPPELRRNWLARFSATLV